MAVRQRLQQRRRDKSNRTGASNGRCWKEATSLNDDTLGVSQSGQVSSRSNSGMFAGLVCFPPALALLVIVVAKHALVAIRATTPREEAAAPASAGRMIGRTERGVQSARRRLWRNGGLDNLIELVVVDVVVVIVVVVVVGSGIVVVVTLQLENLVVLLLCQPIQTLHFQDLVLVRVLLLFLLLLIIITVLLIQLPCSIVIPPGLCNSNLTQLASLPGPRCDGFELALPMHPQHLELLHGVEELTSAAKNRLQRSALGTKTAACLLPGNNCRPAISDPPGSALRVSYSESTSES
mmetsp:Transcript_75461/g.212556  ORF Transcript_75461/g.212556 Transcript_75461/m.212556 type:complete len:294 (+) Transcript_75461:1962-2843(+)